MSPGHYVYGHPSLPRYFTSSTLLFVSLPDAIYFTVVDLRSAFFRNPIHLHRQYMFSMKWENQQHTWKIMSHDFTEAPIDLSQILNQYLNNRSRYSTIPQYVDVFLLNSIAENSPWGCFSVYTIKLGTKEL